MPEENGNAQYPIPPVAEDEAEATLRLRHSLRDLEHRVNERTAELTAVVQTLNMEVREREQAERSSRAQASTLIRTIEQLTQDHRLEEFPAIVISAIADQLGANGGSLWIYDEVTDTAEMMLCYEVGQIILRADIDPLAVPHTIDHHSMSGWEDMKGRLLRGESFLVSAAEEDKILDPDTRAFMAAKGIRTLLIVPLLLQGRLMGYCRLGSIRHVEYGHHDLALAQALAHQAILAIQMSRLSEQARRTAVLDERNRMAREIHDTLAQAFTGILMQLGSAERLLERDPVLGQAHLQSIRDLAREGLAEARRSVQALRPQAMENRELADALAQRVQQLNSGQAPRLEFHLHGAPRGLLSDGEDHLLRIGQEALINALRHAQADTIRMDLTFADTEVTLSVEDNGQGFDVRSPKQKEGFGLMGMRERANLLDAELTVASEPGRGTRVVVTWQTSP